MTALLDHLLARIARDGPITVAQYMGEALGHAEHGYYRKRDPLGRAGDFTTAPEISQVFGELLGLWCAMVWTQMGRPPAVHLVELGPGRGTLMVDMIRAATALPDFVNAAHIHMVETSPTLREKQRAALTQKDVQWHDDFDDIPDGPLIVVANEFFDALPIEQYVFGSGGWRKRMVDSVPGNGLQFRLGQPANFEPEVSARANVGDFFETCEPGQAIAAALAARITKHGGAALIVDYGHGSSAFGDTFQALKDHAFHPVLDDPGDADLTAHVDFAALARSAKTAGARTHGVITQGELLTRLGIEARTEQLCFGAGDPATIATLRSATARLIDGDAMGTLFKATAFSAPDQPTPPGFEE